jgi:uncharacterized hydrophobic protein (TIGR00341 family)
MRQLLIKVQADKASAVQSIAKEHQAKNVVAIPAEDGRTYIIHLSNNKLDSFIKKLDEAAKPEITFIPYGVITLYPPSDKAPDQVTDVATKSSLEIYTSGLQSIGSIKGMLGYSLASGLVAAVGLYTETIYLLTASMLIAPFAGPAMNAALGTAAGEWKILRQSVWRYFLSIFTTIAISALFSFIIDLEGPTSLMTYITNLSSVALVLPLVAGFAGAISLVQSQRDSLVSGAAVGILVAASLAPPAAIAGMATAIGEWKQVTSSLFLILLQLSGINLAAALVFRYYGKINTKQVRFQQGKEMVFGTSLVASALIFAALLVYQFETPVNFQRGSLKHQVDNIVSKQVKEVEGLTLVESSTRFTVNKIGGQQALRVDMLLLSQLSDTLREEKKKVLIANVKDEIREKEIDAAIALNINFAE